LTGKRETGRLKQPAARYISIALFKLEQAASALIPEVL